MTLAERFHSLTPEGRERFTAVKDSAELDALLSEISIKFSDSEKEQIREFITSGKLPMADEELINAAGGVGCGDVPSKTCPKCGTVLYKSPLDGLYSCKCGTKMS